MSATPLILGHARIIVQNMKNRLQIDRFQLRIGKDAFICKVSAISNRNLVRIYILDFRYISSY